MPQPRLASIATHSSGHALPGSVADAIAAQRQLTGRDRELIALLADHRVLTAEQISRLFYTHDNTARKRLIRLTERGILEVPPEQWTGLQAAFAAPVRDCS